MLTPSAQEHPDPLAIDAASAAAEIERGIRRIVGPVLGRRGVVLGVSGGIDSAVSAALAARALGPERVRALLMPERESSPESTQQGRQVCAAVGIEPIVQDITAPLEALGCYTRRDMAIRRLFPDYGPGWRQKIAVADGPDRLPTFHLTVEAPDRTRSTVRMPVDVYLAVVAATNLKQRVRKTVEYTWAETDNLAVLGTPNRLEYALGFFVRGGDGLADLKPIAHLYKSQVHALAAYLGVPDSIRRQAPTTDTYTLHQTQEEFYYALPLASLDRILHAHDHGQEPAGVADRLGLPVGRVEGIYRDIARKRRLADRLLGEAQLIAGFTGTAA